MPDTAEIIDTVDASGNAVTKRMPNARVAHAIYTDLRRGSEGLALSRSRIQGMYDGNPSVSQGQKSRRGLAWMTTIDWGEFRANMRDSVSTIYNMLTDTDSFFELEYSDPSIINPLDRDYDYVIGLEVTRTLRQWDNFHHHIMLRLSELMKFGLGPVFWRDEDGWKSEPIRNGNILFPAKTESAMGSHRIIMIRDEMDVIDLIKTIEDEELAKEAGWDVAAVKRQLVKQYVDGCAGDTNDRYTITDYESVQQAIKNDDDAYDQQFDGVRLVHCLTVEILAEEEDEESGNESRVTHQIMFEDDSEEMSFVFEDEGRFDKMSCAIQVMLFDIGDGFLKSVRGLGKELFHPSHVSNQLINDLLNGVKIASGLIVKSSSQAAAQRGQIIRRGPVTILPEEYEPQQHQVFPTLQPLSDARSMVLAIQQNNVGKKRSRSENPGAGEKTAAQVRSEENADSKLERSQSEWIYIQWEMWLQETFKRLLNPEYPKHLDGYKECKKLKERLLAKGVPEHLIDSDAWIVKARRAIGLGTKSAQMQITSEMMGNASVADEIGRNNIAREWYAARVGWDNVDRFVPKNARDRIPSWATAMAETETVDMAHGEARTVSADDQHPIHIAVHLGRLGAMVNPQDQSQRMDLQTRVMGAALHIQHIAQHIGLMERDPSRAADVAEATQALQAAIQRYKQLEGILKQQQAQEAAQKKAEQKTVQEAQEQVANHDFEVEKYKIDRLAEVKLKEAEMLNESRWTKTIGAIETGQLKLSAQIEDNKRETDAKITTMISQAVAKMQKDNLETQGVP